VFFLLSCSFSGVNLFLVGRSFPPPLFISPEDLSLPRSASLSRKTRRRHRSIIVRHLVRRRFSLSAWSSAFFCFFFPLSLFFEFGGLSPILLVARFRPFSQDVGPAAPFTRSRRTPPSVRFELLLGSWSFFLAFFPRFFFLLGVLLMRKLFLGRLPFLSPPFFFDLFRSERRVACVLPLCCPFPLPRVQRHFLHVLRIFFVASPGALAAFPGWMTFHALGSCVYWSLAAKRSSDGAHKIHLLLPRSVRFGLLGQDQFRGSFLFFCTFSIFRFALFNQYPFFVYRLMMVGVRVTRTVFTP